MCKICRISIPFPEMYATRANSIGLYDRHLFCKDARGCPILRSGAQKALKCHRQACRQICVCTRSLQQVERSEATKHRRTAWIQVLVALLTLDRHLSHVGFDPESGFSMENIPDDWKTVFSNAGITQEQLQNKETATFIYEFMNKNTAQGHEENETKPSSAQLPPPSKPSRPAPSAPRKLSTPSVSEQVPAPSVARQVPVPPPMEKTRTPPPPPIMTTGTRSPPHSGYSERADTTLAPATSSGFSRDSLMDSIRSAGVKSLKAAPACPPPPSTSASQAPSSPTNIMASLLKQALDDRSKRMMNDSAPGMTPSSDEDW